MNYSKASEWSELRSAGGELLDALIEKHIQRGKRRKPSEWTKQERRLGQSTGPLTNDGSIPYEFKYVPWCEEMMDEAVSQEVQYSVWWLGSGLAKTETAVNLYGWVADENPTNIFSVRPNEKSVQDFSQKVITPAIESTPCLKEKFAARKRTSEQNTIHNKRFAGGNLSIVAATSTNNFRGPRAGMIHCDEVDGFAKGGEGDRIALARMRAFGYKAIEVFSGTGTFERTTDLNGNTVFHSTIDEWFDKTDQRKWHCQCRNPQCRKDNAGGWQVLVYHRIKYNPLDLETARYHCEFCDTAHTDTQRRAMVLRGRWIATKPENNGRRGYWLNGLVSLFPPGKGFTSSLVQWVSEELDAVKGGRLAMRVRKNTFHSTLDEIDEEGEPAPDADKISRCRENYIKVPKEGLVITAGVDCQKNRLEVNWTAYGRDESSWGLEHRILPGDVQSPEVWDDLEKELLRKWDYYNGNKMELSFALVDAGKWPDWVFSFLSGLRKKGSPLAGRIRACRGSAIYPHPLVALRYTPLARNLYGHWVGGDEAKDLIYSRLRRAVDPDATDKTSLPHYNKNFDDEFFKQLTAEKVSVVFRNGEEIRRFKNLAHVRNEALDTTVYGLAAFRIRRWDFDKISEGLEIQSQEQIKAIEQKRKEEEEARDCVGYSSGGWSL